MSDFPSSEFYRLTVIVILQIIIFLNPCFLSFNINNPRKGDLLGKPRFSYEMAGKFKDKSKRNKPKDHTSQPTEVVRVRTPKQNEVIGIVEQRVGANRMVVKCLDDKERNCRIPGSLRRRLWIRPGDTVIVKPWEFEGDIRGDILFKYTPAAIEWLKRKGFIKEVSSEF